MPDDGRAHVIAPRRRSGSAPIVNHRQPLSRADVLTAGGLAVTTPLRTGVDCLGWLPMEDALDLWAWTSTRQIVTRQMLAGACAERIGWRGTSQPLALLKVIRRGAASRAELRLHQLLDGAGITGWVGGARVSDRSGVIGVVDVLFTAQRVVIEVDGWGVHGTRTAFEHDRRRQNRLAGAGYLTLRVTWEQLTGDRTSSWPTCAASSPASMIAI